MIQRLIRLQVDLAEKQMHPPIRMLSNGKYELLYNKDYVTIANNIQKCINALTEKNIQGISLK